MRDLVVVTADKDAEFAVRGILSRPQAIPIRNISFDVYVHPQHDPGCFLRGDNLLATFRTTSARGLLMFDRDGCGQESLAREEIETQVTGRFVDAGWGDWAAAVVIDPELENWVWSDSPQVDHVLGWKGRQPKLRDWLRQESLLEPGRAKPSNPKQAFDRTLREVGKRHSSAIFRELAAHVSFQRCADPSFLRLRDLLKDWFPPN